MRALSFKSARQFTIASHLAQPSLTKSSPPRPATSPAYGKGHPTPPRTSTSIQFATKQRRAARPRPLRRMARGWARRIGSAGCVSPLLLRMGARGRCDPRPVTRSWQDGQVGWRVACFRSSPHPSPGAYKRRIAKPSALFFHLSVSPSSSPVCLAPSFASLLRPLFTAPRCLPSLHLHSGLVCDRHFSGTSAQYMFH